MSNRGNDNRLQDRPPLANAETISNGVYTWDNIFKNGKKQLSNTRCSQKRGVRTFWRSSSADAKVREEGGNVLGTRADIPIWYLKTIMKQAVPLQPMEDSMQKQVDA